MPHGPACISPAEIPVVLNFENFRQTPHCSRNRVYPVDEPALPVTTTQEIMMLKKVVLLALLTFSALSALDLPMPECWPCAARQVANR